MIMQCGVREVNAFLAWGQPPWAVQPRLRKRQASISIRLRIVGYMDHLPLPGTTASSPPQRWADMHFLFWEQPKYFSNGMSAMNNSARFAIYSPTYPCYKRG